MPQKFHVARAALRIHSRVAGAVLLFDSPRAIQIHAAKSDDETAGSVLLRPILNAAIRSDGLLRRALLFRALRDVQSRS
jgi:hypothetical protein